MEPPPSTRSLQACDVATATGVTGYVLDAFDVNDRHGEVDADLLYVADDAVLDGVYEVAVRGEEARPQRLHQEQLLPLGQLAELARVLLVEAHGLLAEHVLAVLEHGGRQALVLDVDRADVDDVWKRNAVGFFAGGSVRFVPISGSVAIRR